MTQQPQQHLSTFHPLLLTDYSPQKLIMKLRLAAISSIESLKTITWDKVKTTTISDPIMLHLLETIESGFPKRKEDVPQEIQEYHTHRENLWTTDGVIL